MYWEDDAGQMRANRGYRIQESNAIGPYKGGIRFHHDVQLDTLKFLAFEQTFKNNLTGLLMGGVKGGADCNLKRKSERELMRFCLRCMSVLARHIGPHADVPAADIVVGARVVTMSHSSGTIYDPDGINEEKLTYIKSLKNSSSTN